MNATLENSEAAILDRLFHTAADGWPHAAARAILNLGFATTDQQHMSELLDKAKAGSLDTDELRVLKNYRHVGRLVELMKSRARHLLAKDAA